MEGMGIRGVEVGKVGVGLVPVMMWRVWMDDWVGCRDIDDDFVEERYRTFAGSFVFPLSQEGNITSQNYNLNTKSVDIKVNRLKLFIPVPSLLPLTHPKPLILSPFSLPPKSLPCPLPSLSKKYNTKPQHYSHT